jgi:hypothetical protein
MLPNAEFVVDSGRPRLRDPSQHQLGRTLRTSREIQSTHQRTSQNCIERHHQKISELELTAKRVRTDDSAQRPRICGERACTYPMKHSENPPAGRGLSGARSVESRTNDHRRQSTNDYPKPIPLTPTPEVGPETV